MKIKFKWEEIKDLPSHKTYRGKVHQGWLVSTASYLDGELKSESMVFLPDKNHEWEVE